MKFCKHCGSSLDIAADPSSQAQSQPQPTETLTCPKCGAPTSKPGQRFCAVCGRDIMAASNSAANADTCASNVGEAADSAQAQPVSAAEISAPFAAAASTAAAPVASAPASPSPAKSDPRDRAAEAKSKFDSFMGASVDVSQVGKDFNASWITLEGAAPETLSAAFACFGKAYEPTGTPIGIDSPELSERRKQAKADAAERAAIRKERRTFGAREGRVVYGELAAKLQPGVGPTVSMVASEHDDAARRQSKSRLKHNVALGEMNKKEAIEQAQKA